MPPESSSRRPPSSDVLSSVELEEVMRCGACSRPKWKGKHAREHRCAVPFVAGNFVFGHVLVISGFRGLMFGTA